MYWWRSPMDLLQKLSDIPCYATTLRSSIAIGNIYQGYPSKTNIWYLNTKIPYQLKIKKINGDFEAKYKIWQATSEGPNVFLSENKTLFCRNFCKSLNRLLVLAKILETLHEYIWLLLNFYVIYIYWQYWIL